MNVMMIGSLILILVIYTVSACHRYVGVYTRGSVMALLSQYNHLYMLYVHHNPNITGV